MQILYKNWNIHTFTHRKLTALLGSQGRHEAERRSLQVEGGGVVEAVGGGGRLLEQSGGGGGDEGGGGGAGGLGAEGGLGRRGRGRDHGPGGRSNGPRGSRSRGSRSGGSSRGGRLGSGRGVSPQVAKAFLIEALDAEDFVADALSGSPQDLDGAAVVLHVGVEAVEEAVLAELLSGCCAVFLKELVTELIAVLEGLE